MGCLKNKQQGVPCEWTLARMLGRGLVVTDLEYNSSVWIFFCRQWYIHNDICAKEN